MVSRSSKIGLAFFSLVLAGNLSLHGMWGDELQAWSLAWSSESLLDLYQRLQFEGHPMLWHAVLFPLTRMTADPVAMQGLQWVIVSGSLALIWLASPFTTLEKALISSSLPLAFEHGTIARSYGLGILLLLLFVGGRSHWRQKPWVAWILLSLLANCHLFYVLSSLVLAALWIRHDGRACRPGILLYLPALAFSGMTMMRADATTSTEGAWDFGWSYWKFCHKFGSIAKGFLPLKDYISAHYWGPEFYGREALVLGLLALFLLVGYLQPQPFALGALLFQIIVMISFFYLRFGGHSWHAGVLFTTFLAVVWWLRGLGLNLGHRGFLLIILTCSALAGWKAMLVSKVHPVSAAKQAAGWIEHRGLRNELWLGFPIFPTLGVATYMQRPIHFVECGLDTTYSPWGLNRPIQVEEVPAAFLDIIRRRGRDHAYLVQENDLRSFFAEKEPMLHNLFRVTPLWSSSGYAKENYSLYRLDVRDEYRLPMAYR